MKWKSYFQNQSKRKLVLAAFFGFALIVFAHYFFPRTLHKNLTISDVEFNIEYRSKIKKNRLEYITIRVNNLNNFSIKAKVNVETQPINGLNFLMSDSKPVRSKVIHWHYLNQLHPYSHVKAEIPFTVERDGVHTISISLRLAVTKIGKTYDSVVNLDIEVG